MNYNKYIVNFDKFLDKNAGSKKQQKKEKEFEQFEIINNIVQKNNSNKKQTQ